MRTGSVAFLFGVLLLCRLPDLPSPWLLLALPLGLRGLRCEVQSLRIAAWCCCGLLWALLRGAVVLLHDLDPAMEGVTLTATGRVASLPVRRGEALRFDFAIEALRDPGGRIVQAPRRARLGWYRNATHLLPGERWQLPVRLRRPVGFMNPGGFDYEGWLFQGGVRAVGYVVDRGTPLRLETAPATDIDLYRSLLRDRLDAYFGDESGAGLIKALVLGDQSGISAEQWRVMARTGTTHLLAISGLHISLVAALVFLLLRWTWPLSHWLSARMPAQRAAAPAALLGAVAYSALAGFSVPTQRSVVMIAAWALAQMRDRRLGMSDVLAYALLAVLIFDPFAVLSPGFWLSFTAVAAIAWGMNMRAGAPGLWWRWGRVQLVVTIGLLPLLILWFQQVPLLSAPVNLLAVPWVTLVTVPLALVGCALLQFNDTLAAFLLSGSLHSIDALWMLLELAARPSPVMYSVASPSPAAVVLGLAGAFILLLPRGFPSRWLGVVCLLPLCLPRTQVPGWGEWRVSLLDAGQGLAAVVRTQNHVLLYDTGPKFGEDFSAGRAAVLPYLRHEGITTLDMLVLSHGDNDHVGGLDDLQRDLHIERLLAGAVHALPAANTVSCRAGMRWRWDGVEFEILHPAEVAVLSENDRSCVLQLRGAVHAALLPGDIERRGEHELVLRHGVRLRSALLIAPHHGSATSSSQALINAVDPDFVLFPVGYRNRFGFPKQDIIQRYQRHGIRILDTARSGAIEFETKGADLSFRTFRAAARRFWHSRIEER